MRSGDEVRRGRASALVAIGSNLGDRAANIGRALERLRLGPDCDIEVVSRLIETEPVGGPPQPLYLNGAAEVLTTLEPEHLLRRLHEIEAALGRERSIPNGPREIDLDLLLYDDLVIDAPGIRVPHPRMLERSFVLVPAAEIAPERIHPVTRRTLRSHLDDLAAPGRGAP